MRTRKTKRQISTELLRIAKVNIYLLLFLAPFVPYWALVYRPFPYPIPESSSTLLYLSDAPLILAVVLWLTVHLLDASRFIRFTPWFITIPLLVLVTLSGLSCLWAMSKVICVDMFIRLCLMLALYLLIRNEITNWRAAAWALAIGMAVQSVMATAQFYLQKPVGLFFLGETYGPPMDWVRGYGFSFHPNILGGYLAIGLAVSLALTLNATHYRERLVLLFIFGVGVNGLISTFSRSAWLGTVLGLGLAAAVILPNSAARARWGLTFLLLGLVGTGVCLVRVVTTPHYFISRLVVPVASKLGLQCLLEYVGYLLPAWYVELEMTILETRKGYGYIAWELIKKHFPFGVGSANFSLASYLLESDFYLSTEQAYLPVHNVPLLLTAELGPIGGISWIFLLGAFAVVLWYKRTALAQNAWFLGWSIATLALFTIGFFDYYIWSWQYGRIMLWAVVGLWAGTYAREANERIRNQEAEP